MRSIRHLSPTDARRVPWKNGRGETLELALHPPGASFERGDFEWRISRARVEENGPFSNFAGFERILVVVEGDGLLLVHGDAAPRARLRRLEPYRFSGEWPTAGELVKGPIADFNVITRRDAARAEVASLPLGRRSARESLSTPHTFVHVLSGALFARITGEDEPFDLVAGDSLWIEDPRSGDELELTGRGDATNALLVRIDVASDVRA
ncbi:MAG: HutD family protein [Planctomycetes bacterium]|nr:HutD family protein [Planctomycetota bacterium]